MEKEKLEKWNITKWGYFHLGATIGIIMVEIFTIFYYFDRFTIDFLLMYFSFYLSAITFEIVYLYYFCTEKDIKEVKKK